MRLREKSLKYPLLDYDKGGDLERSMTIHESMLAIDTIVCKDNHSDFIVDICLFQRGVLLWRVRIQVGYIFFRRYNGIARKISHYDMPVSTLSGRVWIAVKNMKN